MVDKISQALAQAAAADTIARFPMSATVVPESDRRIVRKSGPLE
jgi:hypothetical protein